MSRPRIAAALVGALLTIGSAVPGWAPVERVAAASCSGWSSHTQPPPTIRVFRHATGRVDTVDFRAYTGNVLSREWISSWTTASLQAGALAVRNYAWYHVLHWRGGTNASGQCFDVRDDTWDQVYDPGRATYSTVAAAVDATWGTLVHKGGAIFPTYYNAGSAGEACGANANGWKAYQWGTQACGLAGRTAAQIIQTYYYPGVTVAGPPAPSPTPSPTPTPPPTLGPTPTPSPTATTPTTASPTGSPGLPNPTVSPTSTATPTPSPPPSPQQTPLPTPPPEQQQPGGGQAGVEHVATPPPPPPSQPAPMVAVAAAEPTAQATAANVLTTARWLAVQRRLRAADSPAITSAAPWRPTGDMRLVTFRLLWRDALDELVSAVARNVASTRAPAAELASVRDR